MRLAWFTPLPPVRSGVADYSAEILPRLAGRHEITVFVGAQAERSAAPDVAVRSAHDFVWCRQERPFDLIVYQLGNSAHHDYTWPYLFRYPGLLVLHDAHLHHARAQALLKRRRVAEYRAELAFDHPDASPDAAEIAIAGLGGPIAYLWPMLRAAVTASRMVAVHNAAVADELRERYPDTPIATVRMGVADPWAAVGGEDAAAAPAALAAWRQATRARHGFADTALVCAAYGGITPEKRLGAVFRAAAVLRRRHPGLRLLLVGRTPTYYDALAEAREAGVADLVTVTGYVSDDELPRYLAAADVALSLRWPTAGETSASWLRCAAAGLATITTELAHEAERPTLDPRSWTVVHGARALRAPQPIGVSIDILDEDHSLALALDRLAADPELRTALGAAARRHWLAEHTLGHMRSDYERVCEQAARAPDPSTPLPGHLRSDGLEHTRELLRPFGMGADTLRPS